MKHTFRALLVMAVGCVLMPINATAALVASSIPHSANGSSQRNWDDRRFFSNWGGQLSERDKITYIKTVHMMLNHSQSGDVAEFYGEEASGQVQVLLTKNNGVSSLCRVFQSMIIKNGDKRHYIETACLEDGRSGWVFYTDK